LSTASDFLHLRRPIPARARQRSGLSIFAVVIGCLLITPVISVVISAAAPDSGTLAHLARTVLADYIVNTTILVFGVGFGTLFIGTSTAWLVTMCRFPGQRFFEWALIMPLAMPAYIIAYAYTDLLSHPGLVQSGLRDLTGWGPRDYWFPNVRSLGGAVTMFVFVLYPYVYLLSRSAFLQQSSCYADASRSLGRSAWNTFWTVTLPLARPAIAGGVTLAVMETLADFGAVSHFGVQTFTTGIYRALLSMNDATAAAQLSTMLLGVVFLVVMLERWERRTARYVNSRNARDLHEYDLEGARAWGATALCALPVLLGFVIPVVVLGHLSWLDGHSIVSGRYFNLIANSLILASLAATVIVMIAFFLAYSARVRPGKLTGTANRLAGLGYAVPGSIIAVGILIPLASFDNALDAFARETFGFSLGLLLTGSIAGLIFAYVVRYMAVGLNGLDAGFGKIPPHLDEAARTLGRGELGVLRAVHLPMLRGTLLTAWLMVFVDVMKELPATLILRPFNYDTLAIQAYRLASDERLAQASTPSLFLVAAGLIPVLILSRRIAASHRRSTMSEPYAP
jgi:iron(III) transport system permease protein